MRRRLGIFWFAEIALAIIAACLVAFIFLGDEERKRVAVIVSDADSGAWERFLAGIRQGAAERNVRIVITGTEAMVSAEEERVLIEEEIASGADAVIVQPAPGEDTLDMLEDLRQRLPVMLVRDLPYGYRGDDRAMIDLPAVIPDDAEMGTMLAQLLLTDYAGALAGKTLGIVTANGNDDSTEGILQGFHEGIRDSGAEIIWNLQIAGSESEMEAMLQRQSRVDLIAALDTTALDVAGDLSENGRLHGAVIYGVGTSSKALYYLDHNDVAGLVIPNDYDMGYLAITEIAQRLNHRLYSMESQTISSGVYRREDLFLAENTDFLFIGTE